MSAVVELMSLRQQNVKLRDHIATLVFQQCLSANPPRQNPSDAQQPSSSSLSSSQILRADSAPSSAQSIMALARMPSANLAQSTLFRAPSGASQMLTQQTGGALQLMSTQQMSQQVSEERKRYGEAVSAKDDRIKELDAQLKALKQAQQADNKTYKNRFAADLAEALKAVRRRCLLHSLSFFWLQ